MNISYYITKGGPRRSGSVASPRSGVAVLEGMLNMWYADILNAQVSNSTGIAPGGFFAESIIMPRIIRIPGPGAYIATLYTGI